MSTSSIYTDLTRKLSQVRRREHGIAVQAGVLNALAATIAVWTIAITVEVIGELDVPSRTALYWAAVASSGCLIAWLAALPLGRYFGLIPGQDDDTIARRVGTGIPEIGDRLVNTLQLYRASDAGTVATGYSPELVQASIAVQGEPLRAYDYTVIIEQDERRRALLLFISAVVMMSSLFVAFPVEYRGALYRLRHYTQEFIKPALFSLAIEPGNKQLILGDSVGILVRAEGIPPRTVKLYMQSEGQDDYDEVELRGDTSGTFHYLLPDVKTATKYYAASGLVRTGVYNLKVIERPEIRMLHATVTSPAYTGRGIERLPDNIGDVAGIRGAGVHLDLTTNIQPATATIVQIFPKDVHVASTDATSAMAAPTQYDTARVAMKIAGTSVTGDFRLTRNGEYYIVLVSPEGIVNPSPIHYSMSVSEDGAPSITLVTPSGQVNIDETMLLPTEVRISDDYGFSKLRVMYRLSASKYDSPWKDFKPQAIPIPKGSPSALDVPYIWDMRQMNMVPEDEVEMYFEVYDNDIITGPKVARTSTVTVRFPSFEEVVKNADETQAQANADLEKVLKQAQEARRQMDELNRDLMKQLAQNKQQPNWQEQQKLQETMKQHEEMEKRLDKIAENLESMAEKLQQAKAISPETMKKYMEVQKLFEQLRNTELMKSMMQLQKAMEKMTPEQMAEAMKNYKFNEEQFRQAIERTMKILERMQTEQKVDEMIRRAEDLQQKQDELNKQMAATNPKDDAARQQLAERQKDLAKQAEQLNKETKDLAEQMSKVGEDMPNQEMQDAQQSLEQDDPQEHMDQAGEQMQKGEMQQAQKQGQQAQKSAQNFKQKMQAVKQKMQENNKREVLNKMRKSLQDVLDLSKRQEDLKNKTENAQPNSQQFRDLAQQQAQLQQNMQNIANQMMSLSQKSFAVTPEMGREIGDALRQMQGATQSLEQRDGFNAERKEGQAMGAMNRSAMMMQQGLAQMEGGQQPGQGQGMGMGMASFQQRLQQLAAQQQMINMAMGQGQQGQGQGEGEGQEGEGGKKGKGKGKGQNGESEGGDGEGLGRLAKEQGQVKKSLEDLNREAKEQGGTRKNMVGDLERAAKEIEEVMNDMQSGQITPQTLDRQEHILSRLLDAVKSARERDFEKERESRAGVDVTRQSPPELDLKTEEGKQRLQRDLLRSQQQGYSKDYEYMIRQYFEALQTMNNE